MEKRFNSQGKEIKSNRAWREENEGLRRALKEITKGAGAYSTNPLEHAGNCISEMQVIARGALNGMFPDEEK